MRVYSVNDESIVAIVRGHGRHDECVSESVDTVLCESALMTDETSGYAIGSIPAILPSGSSAEDAPRVMLGGQCIGRLQQREE